MSEFEKILTDNGFTPPAAPAIDAAGAEAFCEGKVYIGAHNGGLAVAHIAREMGANVEQILGTNVGASHGRQ